MANSVLTKSKASVGTEPGPNRKGSDSPYLYFMGAIAFSLLLYFAYCIPAVRISILAIDTNVAYTFNSIVGHSAAIDRVMAFLCTKQGDICVLGLIVSIFCVQSLYKTTLNEAANRGRFWFWAGVWCLAAYLISSLISDSFIPRPTPLTALDLTNVQELYGVKLRSSAMHSYPSGHCLAYLMFAIASIKQYPRMSALIAVLGLITMSLRLALGLHWLSDILMGSLPLTLLVLSFSRLPMFDGVQTKITTLLESALRELGNRGFPVLRDKVR